MHAAVFPQANQQQLQYNSLIPKFLILAPQVTEFLNSSTLLYALGTPHCHLRYGALPALKAFLLLSSAP